MSEGSSAAMVRTRMARALLASAPLLGGRRPEAGGDYSADLPLVRLRDDDDS